MSSATQTPEVSIMTLSFKVNRFIKLSQIMLLPSLNKLIVKECEFIIASTSINKLCNDSSLRLVPRVFNKRGQYNYCFCFLSLPYSTHIAGLRWIPFLHHPFTTIDLHEIIDPLLVRFCKILLKFRRSSNKVTPII